MSLCSKRGELRSSIQLLRLDCPLISIRGPCISLIVSRALSHWVAVGIRIEFVLENYFLLSFHTYSAISFVLSVRFILEWLTSATTTRAAGWLITTSWAAGPMIWRVTLDLVHSAHLGLTSQSFDFTSTWSSGGELVTSFLTIVAIIILRLE